MSSQGDSLLSSAKLPPFAVPPLETGSLRGWLNSTNTPTSALGSHVAPSSKRRSRNAIGIVETKKNYSEMVSTTAYAAYSASLISEIFCSIPPA